MKKKISVLLIFLLLIPVLSLSVSANQTYYVIDQADLMSGSEEAALYERIVQIKNTYGRDVVILTVDSLNGKRAQDFADDYYDDNGDSQDGILFLLAMGEREWYISTSGDALYALTDYGIEQLSQEAVDWFSAGYYYDGFDAFLQELPEYLDAYVSGSPVDGYGDYSGDYYHGDRDEVVYYDDSEPSFVLSLLIGLAVGGITIAIMRSSMKTARLQRSAAVYLKKDTYRLTGHRDMFLYSNVSKVRKQQNSSSGGGSSVHRSSGGGRHGGGGGKF